MKKVMLMLVLILIFTGCGRDDMLNDKTKEKNTVYGVITEIKPEGILVHVGDGGYYFFYVSENTEVYTKNGVKADIRILEVGQNIKALHTGNVDLSNPAHTEAVSITIVH
jgi:hypothetical protein